MVKEKRRLSKKSKIVIAVCASLAVLVLLFFLFVPFTGFVQYRDGGTKVWRTPLYTYVEWNRKYAVQQSDGSFVRGSFTEKKTYWFVFGKSVDELWEMERANGAGVDEEVSDVR